MQYIGFLSLLISYGDKVRQHWPVILAAYQAMVELYKVFDKELPGSSEGTLQLVQFTDDELNAEERLAAMIDGDRPSLAAAGRFRKVFDFLKASGLLDVLLGKVLGS
jgi:hypothetical protein